MARQAAGARLGCVFSDKCWSDFSFRPTFPNSSHRFTEPFGVKMSVRQVLVPETADRKSFQASIFGLQRLSLRTVKT
jgi:hypothetical protein